MKRREEKKKYPLGTFSEEVRKEAEEIKEQVRGKMKPRRGSIEKP